MEQHELFLRQAITDITTSDYERDWNASAKAPLEHHHFTSREDCRRDS
jgi:hypothetical protein